MVAYQKANMHLASEPKKEPFGAQKTERQDRNPGH